MHTITVYPYLVICLGTLPLRIVDYFSDAGRKREGVSTVNHQSTNIKPGNCDGGSMGREIHTD